MKREIEWTAEGEKYSRALVAFSPEWLVIKNKIRDLRERYGFPYWEIKKAITNSGGDEIAALSSLQERAREAIYLRGL